MKINIKEIASVQMGYSFRSPLGPSQESGIAVIQMRDLKDDNTVNCHNLVKINMEDVNERHLVRRGDLIFRSRGQLTTAAVLLDDPGIAIVAAPLLRIRVNNSDTVLPEYLNWYINQRDAQIFLTSRMTLKMISKEAIEDMEVAIPSLEKQKNLVEMTLLSSRERSLLQQLAEKRERYTAAILMRIATGE